MTKRTHSAQTAPFSWSRAGLASSFSLSCWPDSPLAPPAGQLVSFTLADTSVFWQLITPLYTSTTSSLHSLPDHCCDDNQLSDICLALSSRRSPYLCPWAGLFLWTEDLCLLCFHPSIHFLPFLQAKLPVSMSLVEILVKKIIKNWILLSSKRSISATKHSCRLWWSLFNTFSEI